MKFFKLKNIEDDRELYYKVKKNACSDLELNRRMLDRTKISVKELGGEYRPHHKGWCLTVIDSEEDNVDVSDIYFEDYNRDITTKESEEEVKPKYTLSNGVYRVNGKRRSIEFSEDDLRKIKKLYCLEHKNINEVCLSMNILRDDFFLIKNAFSLVKTDVPFIDKDIDVMTAEDMADQSRRDKKLAYYQNLEKLKYQDMERELKKLTKKDYIVDKALEMFKGVSLEQFTPVKRSSEGHNNIAILNLSDIHSGMKIDFELNVYNRNVMGDRFRYLTESTINLLDQDTKLVVLVLGDLLHGGIHVSGRINSDMDVMTSVKEVTSDILEMLRAFTYYFDEVEYRTVAGNHDRVTPNKTEMLECENFLVMSDWFMREATKNWERFSFPENRISKIAEVDVFDGKIVGLHGEEKSFGQIKEVMNYVGYIPKQVSIGHLHHHKVQDFGRTKVQVNGSMCGIDDYAKSKLLFSRPMQLLEVFREDGLKTTHEIYLD